MPVWHTAMRALWPRPWSSLGTSIRAAFEKTAGDNRLASNDVKEL